MCNCSKSCRLPENSGTLHLRNEEVWLKTFKTIQPKRIKEVQVQHRWQFAWENPQPSVAQNPTCQAKCSASAWLKSSGEISSPQYLLIFCMIYLLKKSCCFFRSCVHHFWIFLVDQVEKLLAG
jgi:hypothetical protein